MITLKLKQWVVIDNLEHVATSWRVCDSIDLDNVLDLVEKDEDRLNLYYSPVVVPIGSTYYVQAKRHFKDSETDEEPESEWVVR